MPLAFRFSDWVCFPLPSPMSRAPDLSTILCTSGGGPSETSQPSRPAIQLWVKVSVGSMAVYLDVSRAGACAREGSARGVRA